MLNENAKAWVAALRSGEYEQCKGRLTDGTRFCCLGVAAQISGIDRADWVTKAELTQKVREWLGLTNEWGGFRDTRNIGCSLVDLNDDDGKTFAEIADIVESEPKGLFDAEAK